MKIGAVKKVKVVAKKNKGSGGITNAILILILMWHSRTTLDSDSPSLGRTKRQRDCEVAHNDFCMLRLPT